MRFKGFKNNWENTKIGDCLDVKYGKDYKHLNEGKYPVLGTGGVMEYVDEFLYSGESILIGRKGTIDKPKYINDSFWTVDTLFYTEIKKQFPKFLFYCISNINWLKYNEASGVPSLSANNIKNVKINIPELIEQKKIANFLTSIDYKIELLEAKHKSYVEFKRYLMQQIFTQKLRFNFDDEWKQYKLKDVLTVKSSSISINQLEENTGDYPLYGASGFLKNIDFCEMDVDYISIVKDGSGVGNLSFHEKNSSIVNTSQYLLPKKNFNINFLYYLLQTINLMKYVNGSSIPHIYFKDYCIEKINIPSLDEQEKIGKLFVDVDITMENLNKNINATQEFKKGLLQQMFVVQLILSLLQNKKHI